jgi:hypothetical protein
VVLGTCLLLSAFASGQGSAAIAKHLADYDLSGLEAKVNLTSIEPYLRLNEEKKAPKWLKTEG